MRKIIFIMFTLFIFPLMAKDLETDTISLQAMDKITGRVKTLVFPVGTEIQFEELSIKAERCITKSPEETPENAAFLTVFYKENVEKKLFKGWMFSSNPSLSAMENEVYDIWVVSCYNKAMESVPSESTEILGNTFEETDDITDSNEPIED